MIIYNLWLIKFSSILNQLRESLYFFIMYNYLSNFNSKRMNVFSESEEFIIIHWNIQFQVYFVFLIRANYRYSLFFFCDIIYNSLFLLSLFSIIIHSFFKSYIGYCIRGRESNASRILNDLSMRHMCKKVRIISNIITLYWGQLRSFQVRQLQMIIYRLRIDCHKRNLTEKNHESSLWSINAIMSRYKNDPYIIWHLTSVRLWSFFFSFWLLLNFVLKARPIYYLNS